MSALESELQTERSKTVARWFIIAIMAAVVYWQGRHGVLEAPLHTFALIVGAVLLINLGHTVYLFRAASCPPFYKYVTVGLDLIFVSLTIYFTGASESPFFYVYFLILISNCIRYGLKMSLYIAVLVNVCYAVILSSAPELKPTVLGGEGLKILAFWAVAVYGGSVSARIQRQLHEVDSHLDKIEKLQAELRRRDGVVPGNASGDAHV